MTLGQKSGGLYHAICKMMSQRKQTRRRRRCVQSTAPRLATHWPLGNSRAGVQLGQHDLQESLEDAEQRSGLEGLMDPAFPSAADPSHPPGPLPGPGLLLL